MSKTSDKRTTTLKVEKFSHSSHKPRSERWREWYSKLKFTFGAALPMIANQIGQQCDPTSHWWGLEWNSAFFDFDSMSADEEKKCWLEFQTAQYALMDVLSSNFATHEKQIIADHDPCVLTEKVISQYSKMWKTRTVSSCTYSRGPRARLCTVKSPRCCTTFRLRPAAEAR